LVLWNELHQILFYFWRLRVACPSEPLCESLDVRIDNNTFGRVPNHTEYDVARLATNTWQLDEILEPTGHFAVMVLDELFCQADEALCFLTKEPKRRHVRLDHLRLDRSHRACIWKIREELR